MGIIGILLLLGGVVQIGAGTYFMVVLPIFDAASNIWTGAITGFVGAIYMYYGCTNQTKRKHYTNLSLSLVALVANVANLVIIVVGERGIFLSEEDKLQIDRESKNHLYKIAIWGTASTSCTILLMLFIVAQFIFCGYLQIGGSKNKSQPPPHFPSQKNDRFYSPSQVINSKHSSYLIPTLDDMIHSHPSPTSAWVYNGDDKLHGGFYPMGFESHPNSLESGRRPTARHSSFAATPRYAQVLHRPQRAQSFASSRDPFSIHGASYSRAANIQPPMMSRVKRYPTNHVRRSVSMNSYHGVAATLSNKYKAFSNTQREEAVIEVGSLISELSEHSLADALTDRQPSIKLRKILNPSATERKISEKDSNNGSYSRSSSHKGPAPQPPSSRYTAVAKEGDGRTKKNSVDNITVKEHSKEDISDEFCNCKSEEEELISNELLERTFERSKSSKKEKHIETDDETDEETITSPNATKCKSNLQYEGRTISEKQKIANHEDFVVALKSYLTSNTFSDKGSWQKLEQVLMEILNQNIEQKQDLVKKSQSQKTKAVPTKQNMDDSVLKQDIDTVQEKKYIPHQDVQKNKIVLRVPSFKNTSCQTEYYRPVRKRPFSPAHLSKIPSNMPIWNKDMDVQVNMTSSSSSGYSSPEAESKASSPIHSGPPSPSSTAPGSDNGPNVTIIEINRSDSVSQGISSPMNAFAPPKPHRFKNMPRHTLANIHKTFGQESSNLSVDKTDSATSTHYGNFAKTNYSNSTQTNDQTRDDMILAEAVNPTLVQQTELQSYAPRIIDVVPKNRISRHDTFAEIGRQRSPNIRTNSLSLPRVSYAYPNRPRLNRSESRSPSPPKQIAKLGPHPALDKPQSTAAYLASLELLASHYRQQALANAKQLQMQRTMLEQRRKYEVKLKQTDGDSAWQPQTIKHT